VVERKIPNDLKKFFFVFFNHTYNQSTRKATRSRWKIQAYINSISVLSKIIETIVKTRLVDFVYRHAIFYGIRGIRYNANTEAALFDFVAHTQQLANAIWKMEWFSKISLIALDTVNFEKLLKKLAAIGKYLETNTLTGSIVTSHIVRYKPGIFRKRVKKNTLFFKWIMIFMYIWFF
jgi:hypothetical protein